jgi:uncharacterized protein YraI
MTKQRLFSRRQFLKTATALAAAATLGTAAVADSVSEVAAQDVNPAAIGGFQTTAYVNLRTGPGINYSVIRVLPPGTFVEAIGPEQNGFVKVNQAGTIGWVYGQYLEISNDNGDFPGAPLGTKQTTTALNLRDGPGTGYPVLLVMPQGAVVQAYDRFQNGFQVVSYAGTFGWASIDYLTGTGGQPGTLKTSVALNLRAQPSLSGQVLKVLPAGTYVQATNQVVNGFRQVTHNGVTGWAYDGYLV